MRCTQLQRGIQWCRWWGGFYFWQTFAQREAARSPSQDQQGTRITGDTGDTDRGPSTDGGPKEGQHRAVQAPSFPTVRPAADKHQHGSKSHAPRIASSFASHRPKQNAGLDHDKPLLRERHAVVAWRRCAGSNTRQSQTEPDGARQSQTEPARARTGTNEMEGGDGDDGDGRERWDAPCSYL